jgi:hypothetical protein
MPDSAATQIMPAGRPRGPGAAAATRSEAVGALLDRLLFAFILVAWGAAIWCWLSNYATSLG